MLPAGTNPAKPWSFLGHKGGDGIHGYFRLAWLAMAWPHAGEQWFPTAVRIWVEIAKNYRKKPIAPSCQRREGCAHEIGKERTPARALPMKILLKPAVSQEI